MNIKKIVLSMLTSISALALVACSSSSTNSLESIQEKGKLVVATSPDYAPFEFQTLVDGKNKVVGSDIDLAQAIADELGVKLEISTMSFDNVLSSLQTGKADLAISGLAVTEERQKNFDFSDSYYETKIKLLVRKSDVAKYTSLSSFDGVKVAAQKGSIPETLVKEQMSQANLVSLTNVGEAINELKNGQVDAVTIDEPVALSYVASNDDLAVATVELESTEGDANAVAMKKGNTELQEAVNAAIKKIRDANQYEEYLANAAKLKVVE
ncbi:Amino acid ABC transporter, amino acid-binding/permease protein [Streptococcus sp. DD10]|uniref:ABC transporter substrate-binding protein n=1 Tax=Streptococcus sp. DD10 TaxID=1777878 RepID=UPI0007925A94|nr:ABC transporter substrate-binding protein [Streptococcus sp. DD10]KXT73357.1 Amino acid ABC transporter, amino acid-binding/permease protein [Streptococcus sp. DD10]